MPASTTSQTRPGGQELHRIWTERLYREFDNILYQYRVALRRPILRIEPIQGKWGLWDPLARTITLSSILIEKHPWDAVIEILKHEMAHQMVTDVFGLDHTHGRHFAHCCKVLRVADWAARASGGIPDELPSWKDRAMSSEEERLLKRVEKLLNLASSSNEHEALLAMQRVQEIYARYNLERLRDHREARVVNQLIYLKKKRIERSESMVFSILAEHFFVRVIYCQLFDARDLCLYKTVELIGARENVLMAEYVYHFLTHKLRALWEVYKDETGRGGSRQDYMLGVLSGFREKLEAGREGVMQAAAAAVACAEAGLTAAETRALTRRGEEELEVFVRQRYPRLGTRHWNASYRDHSAFAAGVEEGGRIVLHKGLKGAADNRGLRLKA